MNLRLENETIRDEMRFEKKISLRLANYLNTDRHPNYDPSYHGDNAESYCPFKNINPW